jgi:hypothetical protein
VSRVGEPTLEPAPNRLRVHAQTRGHVALGQPCREDRLPQFLVQVMPSEPGKSSLVVLKTITQTSLVVPRMSIPVRLASRRVGPVAETSAPRPATLLYVQHRSASAEARRQARVSGEHSPYLPCPGTLAVPRPRDSCYEQLPCDVGM